MITGQQYKILVDYITHSCSYGEDIVGNIDLMSSHLESSERPMTDMDKLYFYKTIQSNYNSLDIIHNNYSRDVLDYVSNLQKIVNQEYGSVNDFIKDNGFLVSSIFAEISRAVGFPILEENIEDI